MALGRVSAHSGVQGGRLILVQLTQIKHLIVMAEKAAADEGRFANLYFGDEFSFSA